MARAQTVRGPVDADRLGVTLAHEHLLISGGGVKEAFPFLFDYAKTLERVSHELSLAKAGGIDTIVELTTVDLGRDVELYAEAQFANNIAP